MEQSAPFVAVYVVVALIVGYMQLDFQSKHGDPKADPWRTSCVILAITVFWLPTLLIMVAMGIAYGIKDLFK